ncbi:FMN-binding protein [Streptomyces niveiscabiei]|uniref:FMN-binding protein n=1 Tax=Streptomyces niveiscabiei TaxID=164115 RepID=UPI0029B06706|nr:FMN-binding protein [Streptomyces niveiscabiei]MDX3381611.1 FMN-binding protein [Streptomyces niveiscabiei]
MRKSHPLRRVVLASAATVSGIVLLLTLKPSSDPGSSAQASGTGAAAQEAAQGGAGAPVTGTVTGDAIQTQYGNVQVKLTIDSNRITKAEAVQAPSGGQSTQRTADAVPKLNAAVVAKQSPDIDTVSGATYTSEGYKKSLQSAIDKANSGGAQGGSGNGGGQAQASGSFTGDVAQTQYGDVQVRITVAGGKITKSEAVKAPTGGTSTQKTEQSVPKLNSEVLAKQSADVDTVSGATSTSEGYKKSLQSAIDKANAGSAQGGSQQEQGSGSGQAQASGTFTGDAAQTQYGDVQVRITVAGGKVTKAEAVKAPTGGTSTQKTEQSVPKLNSEALAKQSADIDTVSGATYTSEGYKKSLQSALDQAGV